MPQNETRAVLVRTRQRETVLKSFPNRNRPSTNAARSPASSSGHAGQQSTSIGHGAPAAAARARAADGVAALGAGSEA